MKKYILTLALNCMVFCALAQTSKPKLVVGIVIDQMRYDFLYRYYDSYSEKGFKRLMNEGFNCKNNHYHYSITYTGPGHASIYTGSIPAINGIVGNEWYELSGKMMYVTEDSTVKGIGTSQKAGQMSPRNMLTTTITDQLRLSNNFQSKVIGVALKDRGAILPAGHTANAAYWYEFETGKWISSSFYMDKLPDWAEKFNASGRAKQLVETTWQTLKPLEHYKMSETDNQPYERPISGETSPTFPHKASSFSTLGQTPWGNTLTKEFALEAFRKENLGKRNITDFLCVSFSAPDINGHAFGPFSVEVQDMYMRLDLEIAEMLETFDKEIGKGNYLVFLTADHGVADIPAFSKKNRIPAGNAADFVPSLNEHISKKFGEGKWILYSENQQLHLNHTLLQQKNVSVRQVFEVVRYALLREKEVYTVVNLWDNEIQQSLPDYYAKLVKNSYHPKRSGEFLVVLKPAWLAGFEKGGTSHGTFYNYDTHVPLLWFGWQIPKGETHRRTHISDIASTLAGLLNILEPNGAVGEGILEILNK
jgi:predicted AlkP superfamily pyrophosphatase or phosphodiesterase